MTVKQRIDRMLSALYASSQDENNLQLDLDAGRLSCRLSAIDSLSCSFQQLELETPRLANANSQRLKEVTDELSRRLHYLLEPICLVEIDDEHCVLQMRSNPPQKDEQGTSYYELLVKAGGSLSLCRYSKGKDVARKMIASTVTREVLGRMIEDFANAT